MVGNLSVRVDEFDGDNGKVHYARINVNQPQVEKAEQDMPF